MNKVIKVIMVSVALVSVFALCSFTVSANEVFGSMFTLYEAWAFNSSGNRISIGVARPDLAGDDDVYKSGNNIVYPSASLFNLSDGYSGFGFSGIFQGTIRVESGYYFVCNMTISSGTLDDSLEPINIYVKSSDGVMYHLNTSVTRYTGRVEILAGGRVGDGMPIYLNELVVNAPHISAMTPTSGYTLTVSFDVRTQLTLEEQQHQELLDTLDRFEDNFLHGWNSDSHLKEDIDDFGNELNEAESDIFGGDSQEDALGDLDSAFTQGQGVMPSPSGAGSVVVSRFLSQLLNVLGSGVLSVIVMSCMIGLALTILGRSF